MHKMHKILLNFTKRMKIPAIAKPLFMISTPNLVIEQCNSGIIGTLSALNAKSSTQLDNWIYEIKLSLNNSNSIPFAINKIIHPSNKRLLSDLDIIVKHKVPIIITSLGINPNIVNAIHRYGGIVLHDDISTNKDAKRTVLNGMDGLCVSPFTLIPELRKWYHGPIVMYDDESTIYNGKSIAAAKKIGADFVYINTPFNSSFNECASKEYNQMIIDSVSKDVLKANVFTGLNGNHLKLIDKSGLDLSKIKNNINSLSNIDSYSSIWSSSFKTSEIKETNISISQFVKELSADYEMYK